MSQCQGVNIFESGDYLLDERQGSLCTTIERLRAHMVILKEKLQEEKMLLSELKAETQFLTKQQIEKSYISEDYIPNSYGCKHEVSLSGLRPACKVAYTGDVMKTNKTVVEPKQKFLDRTEYVQRLNEIDSLCKEEMARVNNVVEQMEPLKQIASDWMLETRLSEMSGVPVSDDVSPVSEIVTVQNNHTTSGIEPGDHNHPAYPGELIVIPPEKPIPQVAAFMSEGKCGAQSDHPAHLQTPLIRSPKSKLDLGKINGELSLDCLKTTPQNNTAVDRKDLVVKRKKEKKSKTSSSEVSLSSLEALRENNITLIDVTDNNDEDRDIKTLEKKAEEDQKSENASKSAISLESIQRAFANHHKKKRKKGDTSDTDAFSLLHTAHKGREKALGTNNDKGGQREHDKLLAYLHPNAKKIIKNWVMAGKEMMKGSSNKKPERCSKRHIFNLGRHKGDELSLCEDDVINKFLYDEEGYVYTPLFVSESEDERS